MGFCDRVDAGKKLARLLLRYPRQESVILTPLNESIIVAKVAANLLGMPLDLLTISPVNHPFHWDEIIGAVSLDDLFLSTTEHSDYLAGIIPLVRKRLVDRTTFFKKGRLFQTVKAKTVIVITDGSRTGLKLTPSLEMIAQQRPEKIIVASPVAAIEAQHQLKGLVAGLHSLYTPMPYGTTRTFYKDFRLYSDDELERIFQGKAFS